MRADTTDMRRFTVRQLPTPKPSPVNFHFRFAVYGRIQSDGHADGRTGVGASVRPVQLQYQIGITVCDQRRLIETRSNIHHGEDAQPSRNPIEVSDSPLEAREMSQGNEPR